MYRIMWKGHILPGKKEEYIYRHDHIWPEMTEDLNTQGVKNYSIFCCGNELIGYYECDDIERLRTVKAGSEIAKKWAKSMEGIVEFPEGAFEQIFYHEGNSLNKDFV